MTAIPVVSVPSNAAFGYVATQDPTADQSTHLFGSGPSNFDPNAIHIGDLVSGDLTGTYPGPLSIAAGAVTLADMGNFPGNTMMGNNTSSSAAPVYMSASDVLTFLGLGPLTIPVPIADGGTNATTANAALNNLLPSQTGNNGKVLETNGTNTSWVTAGSTTALSSLTDVNISSPANLDLFQYQTSDNKWHNVAGISGAKITSGTVGISFLPTGTGASNVPIGGVITGAGPQGDAAHTQVLTFNNAGQLTTVTNTAIAIANTAVSGLGTASTHAATDFLQLAGFDNGTGQGIAGPIQTTSTQTITADPAASSFVGTTYYSKTDATLNYAGTGLLGPNPTGSFQNPWTAVGVPYGQSPAGPRARIEVEGTTVWNFNAGLNGPAPLLYFWNTFKNEASVSVKIGSQALIADQCLALADGAAVTISLAPNITAPNIAPEYYPPSYSPTKSDNYSGYWGYVANQFYGTINTGTLTLGTASNSTFGADIGFMSIPMLFGNVTLPNRIGYMVREAWISMTDGHTPTITNQYGMYMEPLTAGTTNISAVFNNGVLLMDKDRVFSGPPFAGVGKAGFGAALALQNNYTLDFTNATMGDFHENLGTISFRRSANAISMGGIAFWNQIFKNARRTVTDSVTNGTTTVTSASAAFTQGDVGATVTGTNIAANSTISTVSNATTVILNNAASGSGTGGTLVIVANANLGPSYGLTMSHTVQADTVTINGGNSIDLWSNPTYNTVNGGTLAITGQTPSHTGVQANAVVNTGAHLYVRNGVYVGAATGTGAINAEFGFYCEPLTLGGFNAGLFLGGSSGSALTSGSYGIYSRTTQNYLGGQLRQQGQVVFVPDGATFTDGASHLLNFINSTVNYTTTAGWANTFLSYAPTIAYTVAGTALGAETVFAASATYTSASAVNMGIINAFVSNYARTIDTQTGRSLNANTDFLASPTYQTVNNGQYTAGSHTGFSSTATFNGNATNPPTAASDTGFNYGLTVGANTTVTTATGMKINAPSVSGTLTNVIGVDIPQLTVGGTLNIGFRNAGATVMTPVVITVTAGNPNTCTIPVTVSNAKITLLAANAITITVATTNAQDGQRLRARIYPFSAASQTITWVNTLNSTASVPTATSAVTTTAVTVEFEWDAVASKWLCITA